MMWCGVVSCVGGQVSRGDMRQYVRGCVMRGRVI